MNISATTLDKTTQLDEPVYELTKVGKTYSRNKVNALQGVSLTLHKGSFSSVIGSSGCGKSTLLKIMAGLIPPGTGRVVLQNEPVTGPRRDIGMMFQQATLFPWCTTVENIVLPIEIRDGRKESEKAQVPAHELLNVVGLKGFENVFPNELSGGMAQRASICRMLITDPAVLLLDELFSALDITGEFLGGGKGFGELIRVAASQLQTPRVFSLILYLSLLGLALYALVTWTQRRVVF